MIINDLKSKGWKIIRVSDNSIFAERKTTGKLAFFQEMTDDINKIELMRIWTKLKFHPFLYSLDKYKRVIYFDFLFGELVKQP